MPTAPDVHRPALSVLVEGPPRATAGRFLLARDRIVAALRRWFEAEGFLDVEPAALQVSPGNETHLHAFATDMIGPDGRRTTRYLHTSPEFAMKKLLAAGEEKIVAFARGLPQPRARAAPRAGIHHARVVPGRRAATRR